MDLLLTSVLLAALLCCVIYKAKVHPSGNDAFFDKENSIAFRGIWCIIVILVHIPAQYRNALQDIAGSFAYIGVTFYFMASGYGLSLGVMRNGGLQKGFWRKRLPKLLLSQLLVNLCAAVLFWALLGDAPTILSVLWVARWLRWLLACYVVFWVAHKLCKNTAFAHSIIGIGVLILSIGQYVLKNAGILNETIWPTEIFGFLWGILLANLAAKFQNFSRQKWLLKAGIFCISALILGVLYLKFKPVPVWGDYLLKTLLGLAILVFMLLLNTKISIGNKALNFLGGISYEMYLSHTVIISLIQRLCPELISGVFIWLVLIGSFALSVLIWYVSRLLLKKRSQ